MGDVTGFVPPKGLGPVTFKKNTRHTHGLRTAAPTCRTDLHENGRLAVFTTAYARANEEATRTHPIVVLLGPPRAICIPVLKGTPGGGRRAGDC